jgi:hypothetical protein
MIRRLPQFLGLLGLMACFGATAYADLYPVGVLSYDLISATDDQFDITNGTGTNASLLGFPITTPVTITPTSLTVNFLGGGSAVLPGSDFTVVDAQDDLDCNAAACNLFGSLPIISAVLTGTFSPTTGLAGLTPPDTGVLADFTATLTPSSGPVLVAGVDAALITATGTAPVSSVPEPGVFGLFGATIVGAFLLERKSRRLRCGTA